jgi:serine/threonine protein kinase
MPQPRPHVRMMCHSEWEVVELLGKGAYGCVEKVKHVTTGEVLARKSHYHTDYASAHQGVDAMLLREISILKRVHHEHVLSLEALTMDPNNQSIALFTHLHATNLQVHVRDACHNATTFLPLHELRTWVRQLLQGVDYLHQHCIIHRDLKPANLLLTQPKPMRPAPRLVVADLGMARFIPKIGAHAHAHAPAIMPMTPEVQSQWYRAPEVLLLLGAPSSSSFSSSSSSYGEAIDIFSIGAIMGEWMAHGQPIFQGQTSIDTWLSICRLMGTPTPTSWPELTRAQVEFVAACPQWPSSIDTTFQAASTHYGWAAIDLLKRLLCMNPKHRISAHDALSHEFLMEKKITP